MLRRILIFLLLCFCMALMAAQAEQSPWHTVLEDAWSEWETVYAADIGDSRGLLAVITREDETLTVLIDAGPDGAFRIQVNDRLFRDAVPDHDDLWLGSGTRRSGDPLHPFFWYIPENGGNALYLVLGQDIAGAWQVTHAEFGTGEALCAYTKDGMTATVRGDSLYPQVRTLLTLDLSFAGFNPAEAEAFTRAVLNAPDQYRCCGLDCTENGPCREHGIYLPDAQTSP